MKTELFSFDFLAQFIIQNPYDFPTIFINNVLLKLLFSSPLTIQSGL